MMEKLPPIPDEEGFRAALGQQGLSVSYQGNLVSALRRVIRETGSVPRDMVDFNAKYIVKIHRRNRNLYRTAVRKYCVFRKTKYGEPFTDE